MSHITIRTNSDFNRRGISNLHVSPANYNPSNTAHPIYLPNVSVHQEPVPDAVILMNQKTRFYLKPQPLVFESIKDGVSVSVGNLKPPSHSQASTKSEEEPLDLGIVQLRRIIEQIRGLKSNSKVSTFNPYASRSAGLPTYTEYLHGKLTTEMNMADILREINASKTEDMYQK